MPTPKLVLQMHAVNITISERRASDGRRTVATRRCGPGARRLIEKAVIPTPKHRAFCSNFVAGTYKFIISGKFKRKTNMCYLWKIRLFDDCYHL